MIILGIDPGLERVGYGVVKREGSKITCLAYGLIKTPKGVLSTRLKLIHDEIIELVREHKPDVMATERLLFTKNVTSAMDVAKALGVILLVSAETGIEWIEYSPPEIKLGVVGKGNADKKQVTFMVRRLLALDSDPKPDDVADALAIAICHAFKARR